MGHTRMYLTALTALLVPAGAGVMTVHASPTCEKFVKTYVSTPVRNRVSKATALAWEKWRVGHPNWKPNPRVTRPRYKMSQHEMLKKVDFACQVETQPKMMDILFTPDDLHPPKPKAVIPDLETTDVTVPDTIPPLVAEMPPMENNSFPPDTGAAPVFPPLFGGAPVPPFGTPPAHVSVPPSSPSTPGTPGTPGTPTEPGTPATPVIPVSPVPEPSSLLLMLAGVGWGGATRVWQKRKAS